MLSQKRAQASFQFSSYATMGEGPATTGWRASVVPARGAKIGYVWFKWQRG